MKEIWIIFIISLYGCIAGAEVMSDICIGDNDLSNTTFFVVGNASLLIEWWKTTNSSNASFFLATISKEGAIGWFNSETTNLVLPILPPDVILYNRPLKSDEIDSISDFTTKAMARYFSKLKQTNEEPISPVGTESGTWVNSTAAASKEDEISNSKEEDISDESDIENGYNGKPLNGIVALTMFEVTVISHEDYAWSDVDIQNAEKALFGATLSLSFLGAMHFCKGITWLLELIPHDNEISVVRNITTVSLYDRGVWISQIAPKYGATDDGDFHAKIVQHWKNSTGITVSEVNVVTAFAVTTRTGGPCGLSSGSKHSGIIVHTSDKREQCQHWRPHTILMHEVLHAFGACDEYGGCSCYCTKQWCQNAIPWSCFNNWNCPNCFPTNRCVMRRGEHKACICSATALQIGWGIQRRTEKSKSECGPIPAPAILASSSFAIKQIYFSLVLTWLSMILN